MSILMGILGTAVLLTIVWFFWHKLSQECSRPRRYILPAHRPQQHQPVYQPPLRPSPPSQSYRPSPYTPLLHQPEQHRPVYQPPPRPSPPPSPSTYTPPLHQAEQHRPVYQPPPRLPPPLSPPPPSPYTPWLHQAEQHRPVYQPPPRLPPPPSPPPPSPSDQSSPYAPWLHQAEQHRPVYQPPPRPPPPPSPPSPSPSDQSSPYAPWLHQAEQHRPVYQPPPRPPPPPSPPPPSPPSPSPSDQSSLYAPWLHQAEQHRLVYPLLCPLPPPPPSPSDQSSPHGPPKHEDDNQQDHPNEYIGFRVRATKEKDEEKRCLDESRKAHIRGDHAAAKDLSKQAKNHRKKMEQLNKEASNRIYLENNRNRKPEEIDLHGLYVKEAIAHTHAALKEAKRRGDSEIRIIVGKGLHSGGEARIRPAITGLMRKYQLVAELDPSNSGVLIVKFNGRPHLNISRHHSSGRHGGRRASNIGACA